MEVLERIESNQYQLRLNLIKLFLILKILQFDAKQFSVRLKTCLAKLF
jgi:hypothetical protein